MSRTSITPAETAEIVRLYYEGYTFAEIGRRINRTGDGVRRVAIRTGHHVPRRMISDGDSQKITELYECGVKVDGILDRFCMSAPSLYLHLRRHGVPLRRPHNNKER